MITIEKNTRMFEAEIKKVLDSNLTGYEIQRLTGISRSTIYYLRNGDSAISNLSLKNASRLYELYLEIYGMEDWDDED